MSNLQGNNQLASVEARRIYKAFGALQAVNDVSFEIKRGEFFGLLGPNGAGKTTTIRILLDIFKPDQGSVSILSGPMTEEKKNRIGYMPEERGLYQDLSLERVLTYLASLKGMDAASIHNRLDQLLKQFDLDQHRKKKVKELSKGMQQKAQIIATIIHQPELIIIDEPFSGLDPINTQMVKDFLRDLHRQGATIIMSTHQMHQVEELCDRILLINQGKVMLYGELLAIRRQFSGHAVAIDSPVEIPPLPGVIGVEKSNHSTRLNLTAETSPQAVLHALVEQNIPIDRFEVAIPTLDEIFITVVQKSKGG